MAEYDAFISYSHSKDKPIAAALQAVMQRLGKPWYRRRALRVFRDDTSLSATPHLWPSIEQALKQSRYLVLLASPEAAASVWVAKEVTFWLANKSAQTLLIAVTDGVLSWDEASGDFRSGGGSPLPAALAGQFPTEPKWVDLTAFRAAADQRDPRFMDLGADFAAAIHGIPKEDLLSQEMRQQRRALTLAWSAAATLLMLVGVAGWGWKTAATQRETAQNNFKIALSAAEKNIGLVPNGYLSGKINVDLARTLLDISNSTLSTLSDDEERLDIAQVRMRMYDTFAETYVVLGDVYKALVAAQNALDIAVRLSDQMPKSNERQHFLANSHARLGDARAQAGDLADAVDEFQQFMAIIAKLDPNYVAGDKVQADLWRTHERIGDALQAQNKLAEAQKHYEAMLQVSLNMQRREPSNLFWQWSETIAREDNGDIRRAQGDYDGAMNHFAIMEAKCEKLVKQDPSNVRWAWTLSLGHERVGDILLRKGDFAGARAKYQQFLQVVAGVAALDPAHATRQRGLAIAHERLGDALLASKDFEAALAEYRKDHQIASALMKREPSNTTFKRDLAIALQKLGDGLQAKGDLVGALASYRDYQKIADELMATNSTNADWQLDQLTSSQRVGAVLMALGRGEAAKEEFRKCRSGTVKIYDPRNLWPPFYSPGASWPLRPDEYCREMAARLQKEAGSRASDPAQ